MPRHSRLTLQFQPRLDGTDARKELRDGLSTVLRIGRSLWVANDESATLERLVLDGASAGAHRQFPLRELLDLPEPGKEGDTPEVDLEGMDAEGGWLWIAGSHSLKRCKPEPGDAPRKAQKRLGRIESGANRCLLARIPLVERDGLPEPVRRDGARRATRLEGGRKGNELTRRLRKDRHLGPFVGLPGKENGFDVEGLAVAGERVFLGLRGPVLRGWATVLELRPQEEDGELRLAPLPGDRKERRLRKHFLDLGGLGVRDLCLQGEDLLVLAGPTMSIDGPVRVVRWRGAAQATQPCMLAAQALEVLLELPYGERCDHAEGMTLLGDERGDVRLLVVHDQPAAERQVGDSALLADVYEWPS